jgi:hypothetical protein
MRAAERGEGLVIFSRRSLLKSSLAKVDKGGDSAFHY